MGIISSSVVICNLTYHSLASFELVKSSTAPPTVADHKTEKVTEENECAKKALSSNL